MNSKIYQYKEPDLQRYLLTSKNLNPQSRNTGRSFNNGYSNTDRLHFENSLAITNLPLNEANSNVFSHPEVMMQNQVMSN